jgi:RpiB/LacA/LacB family sugar-phosphate isomerase
MIVTAAVKDGSIPAGTRGRFGLRFEEVPVIIQAFRRMVRSLDFDVTEMAFTTYLCARSFGKPFTALPVFLTRGFHHGAITRSAAAEPIEPRALEGQRAGVNRGYTVTTGVWARGILADQYGVDLDRVTWVPSGDEHVAEYQPPPNVVPAGPGQDVPAMVASGELAAGVGFPSGPGVTPLLATEGAAHRLAEGPRARGGPGTHGPDAVDYPVLCADLGRQVAGGHADRGIVIGGSGSGEQMACNKIAGVRAGVCHDLFTTQIARAHNDANVLIIGAKIVAPALAELITELWLATPFKGGPHQRRLDQIAALEQARH